MKKQNQPVKKSSTFKSERRNFTKLAMGSMAAATLTNSVDSFSQETSSSSPKVVGNYTKQLQDRPLTIAMLVFERMDQIDFTEPYSVLVRIPDAQIKIVGLTKEPIRDHKGLVLTPELTLAEVPQPDVLVIPGGPGQEDFMEHKELLDAISSQVNEGRVLFSICTGALICGAAGILRNRQATTHWAAHSLLPLFGAIAVNERVVVDGDLISAAGVTAGIDGALQLAALLRGPEVAQQIQLGIQYAPEPPFNAGDPETATQSVFDTVNARFSPLTETRERTARRVQTILNG